MSGGLAAAVLAMSASGLHCTDGADQRIHSIYELKREPTAEHVQAIRDMLADEDRDVRATALNALVGVGVPDARELSTAALSDEDPFVRATAAKLAADVGDATAVDPLCRMLAEDPHPIARQRAAEALARLGGEQAVAALAAGLDDPMAGVRIAAVRGLRETDPSAGGPGLARLLLEDPEWEIRVQAARALGDTGAPEFLPALESALSDQHELVRGAAANALEVHRRVLERDGADEREVR